MRSRWIVLGLALLCLTEVWCKPATDKESEDEESDYPGDERPDDDPEEDVSAPDLPVQALTKSMQFNFAPGSTIHLPCQFLNAEEKTVNWLRNEDLLYFGDNKMIQDERLEVLPNNTLVIRNAMPKDSSDYYICRALVDETNSVEIVHRVKILEAHNIPHPMVRVWPSSHVEVMNGEDITIGCEVDKSVNPQGLYFSREGVRVNVNEQSQNKISLVIHNATRHLAGEYQCLVETESSKAGRAKPLMSYLRLRVKHLPEIDYEKESGSNPERKVTRFFTGPGVETNISCVVHSHPPVTKLQWIKDGQKLKMDNRLSKSDSRKSHHVLTIKNTSKADLGTYQCHAWNDLGDVVGPEIQLTDTPNQPIYLKGSSVNNAIVFDWQVISYKPIVESEFLYRKIGSGQWHKSEDVKIISSAGKEQIIRTTIRDIESGSHEALLRTRSDEEHASGDQKSEWGPYSESHIFDKVDGVEAESVRDSSTTSSPLSLMTLLLVILPFATWKL